MPLKIQGYGSDEKIESERSLVWLRNSRREEKWKNYYQQKKERTTLLHKS
jgi:hypothetical protein